MDLLFDVLKTVSILSVVGRIGSNHNRDVRNSSKVIHDVGKCANDCLSLCESTIVYSIKNNLHLNTGLVIVDSDIVGDGDYLLLKLLKLNKLQFVKVRVGSVCVLLKFELIFRVLSEFKSFTLSSLVYSLMIIYVLFNHKSNSLRFASPKLRECELLYCHCHFFINPNVDTVFPFEKGRGLIPLHWLTP